ncbi:MAG: CARDB domain-containing protein [Tepidisphaeraceae bacterium]
MQYQPDANTYNNAYGGVQLQLRQADLSVTDATVDVSTANVGDAVNVSWTVTNNGDATVPPGWVDRIYISSFPTFSEQTAQSLYTFTGNFSMGAYGSSYSTGVDIDTSGLDGGKYYIFVVTDADHTVAETDETNNVSAAVPLTLTAAAGLPDLTASIDSVHPNPAVGNIGVSSVGVTYTINNIGPAPTDGNGWNDAVWLSPTPAFDAATAISLGSFWNNAPTVLPAGSYTNTATVYLPAGVGTGTFYLFVEADVDNNQMESNGGNNLSPAAQAVSVALNGPDLVVTSTTFNNNTGDPSNVQVTLNSPFELDWTIENEGNAASSSDWMDAIYVSDSPVWDPVSASLVAQFDAATAASLPLAPSDSYSATQQISLPGWVGAGVHFLYVVTGIGPNVSPAAKPLVSVSGSINFEPDGDFASNVSGAIRVDVSVPNVDLTVTIDDAPPVIAPGQNVTVPVDWTVTNNGPDTANGNTNTNSDWTDTLYLTQTPDDAASYIYLASYDTAFTGDTPLWGHSSYSASLSGFTIPSNLTSGAWYFVVVTDSNNDQGETDETNNVASIPVQIAASDLTTPKIAVTPTAGTIGQTSLHVTWTVHNGGQADATGGWYDVIYVSSSPVFDSTATELDWVYHPDVLAQGGDYTASDDVTLPGGIGAGLHYIYVVADGFNYLPETDETNNTSDGFAITVSGPDLQVTASQIVSTNPAPAVVNGTVSVSWTVTNTGNTPTTATYWYDYVYVSDNPVYGQGSQWYLGSAYIAAGQPDTGTLPLAAGASYTAHLNNLVIPGYVGAGARYVYVVTNLYYYYSGNQIETNTNNNASAAMPITLGAPDLVVTAASSDSTTATVGGSVTVHWTVTNNDTNGKDPAVGPWYDAVYLSNDNVLSSDDIALFSLYTANMLPVPTPLNVDKSYTNMATITIPSYVGAGAKYLIFVTNNGNNQGEDDYTNNTMAVPITLNAPDLTVSRFTAPATAVVNGPLSLTWTTQNLGQYAAYGPWYDVVYVSNNPVFDPNSATYLGELYTGNLPAGAMPLQPAGSVDAGGNPTDRYTTTQSFTIPHNLALGQEYLFVMADYYNQQTETNETNNLQMLPISIVAPDLTVVNPSGPSSAMPGDTIAVTWTTRNLGTVPAYGYYGYWYDAVYISDDAIFGNADDRFLGYYSATAPQLPLQPAGSVDGGGNPTDRYTVTQNFTIPATMTGGIKHIFIKTDGGYYATYSSGAWYVYGDNLQGETDETNNVAGFSINLGAGAPPVINGTAADDTLYLRRSSDGTLIQAFFNTPTSGAPTWVYGLGASIAFNGLAGSDSLILDFSNGSPIPSGGLAFDGGDGNDSLLVTGTNSSTALTVQPGMLSAGGAVATYANAEQVALDGPADSAVLLGSLTLSGNLAMTAGKNLTLRLSTLSIIAGALDVADNNLILDYAGAAPLAAVRGWLYNGTIGAPAAIITSTPSPAGGYTTALGLVDNAMLHLTSWGGQILTAAANFSQLVIMHTYAGDTNMDGQVTQADYLNVIANMGGATDQSFLGDLNHDGMVTPDDLAVVAANMGAGTSGTFGPPLAVAGPAGAAAPQIAAAPKIVAAAKPAAQVAARKPAVKKSAARKPHKPARPLKARLAQLVRKLKLAAKPAKHRAS